MGFRVGMGATASCRIHNGYIETDWPSKRKYKTTLNIETDWQCNTYESPVVYFLLWHEDKLYIGLNNGAINVVDRKGLLLAIYTWEPPRLFLSLVGFWRDGEGDMREAVMPIDEPQLIMVKGKYISYVLNKGVEALYLPEGIDVAQRESLNIVDVKRKMHGLGITLTGGEKFDEEKHGHWEIDSPVAQNNSIQF